MKKNLHPNYHMINVVMTDGTTFQTRSTWGKEGDSMQLEIDPKTHSAWTKEEFLIEKGKLAKFRQKFQGLGSFKV
jgi:large subunit ribosomal protein L31